MIKLNLLLSVLLGWCLSAATFSAAAFDVGDSSGRFSRVSPGTLSPLMANLIIAGVIDKLDPEEVESVRGVLASIERMPITHENFGCPVRASAEFEESELTRRIKSINRDRAVLGLGVMTTAEEFIRETTEEYRPDFFVYSDVTGNAWPNGRGWADPVLFGENITFRQIRDAISVQVLAGRKRVLSVEETFECLAEEDWDKPINQVILNPSGVTGVSGPGEWGYWGKNLTVDPVVVTDINGVLYALTVARTDTREKAWPGGVVDDLALPFSRTALKELGEETNLNVSGLLGQGYLVRLGIPFEGIIDDKRNSDHSYSHNITYLYYLDPEALTPQVSESLLRPGDETECSKWVKMKEILTGETKMFASHRNTAIEAMRLLFGVENE